MIEKIKPCPFCGGEGRIKFHDNPQYGTGSGVRWVRCIECGAQSREEDSEKDALKAWNRRANEKWIKCSETPPTEGEYYWVDNPHWDNPKVLKCCGNVGYSRDVYFFAEDPVRYNGEFDEYLPIQVSTPSPFYGTGKQRVRNRIEWRKKRGLSPWTVEE